MTALVNRPTRSRRLAGTSERPRSTACGSDVMKYKVRTRMVSAVKKPESTDLPTPMTPPNVLISKVPSEVIVFNFSCKVSMSPN